MTPMRRDSGDWRDSPGITGTRNRKPGTGNGSGNRKSRTVLTEPEESDP